MYIYMFMNQFSHTHTNIMKSENSPSPLNSRVPRSGALAVMGSEGDGPLHGVWGRWSPSARAGGAGRQTQEQESHYLFQKTLRAMKKQA